MRIAYICADQGIPVFGCKGCSLHVQEMVRAFIKRGFEVTLFATNQGGDAPEDLRQVNCITLPKRLFSNEKPDRAQREKYAMQSHHWFMWQLLQRQDFDLVYERYSLWSQAGVDYAALQGIPAVLEVNSPLIDEAKTYRGVVHEKQAVTIAEKNFLNASLICCVSQAVADYVIQTAKKIKPKRKLPVIVTPNAVNPDRFESLSRSSLRSKTTEKITIGFVGTLKPWHGLDYLLQAFAVFHQQQPQLNATLLIVGDGPQRKTMEAMTDELNIADRVQFTGMVNPADIPSWLDKMDIAVAPYPELENFYFSPLKVFEYMAAGLPVIASDIGQIKDIIQHKQQGLLVIPGSITALVIALQELADNPQQAQRLGSQAQAHIFSHYTWDAVAQTVLEQVAKRDQRDSETSQLIGADQ